MINRIKKKEFEFFSSCFRDFSLFCCFFFFQIYKSKASFLSMLLNTVKSKLSCKLNLSFMSKAGCLPLKELQDLMHVLSMTC